MEEPVGEQQHEHGEQWRDRGVHREVGAFAGAFEVAGLFGAGLAGLLAEEVEVGALLRGEQLGEAGEGRLAGLACDLDERVAFGEALVAAGERERAFEFGRERPVAVAGSELERPAAATAQRRARVRARRSPPGRSTNSASRLRFASCASSEVGDEESDGREQTRDEERRWPSDSGRVGASTTNGAANATAAFSSSYRRRVFAPPARYRSRSARARSRRE